LGTTLIKAQNEPLNKNYYDLITSRKGNLHITQNIACIEVLNDTFTTIIYEFDFRDKCKKVTYAVTPAFKHYFKKMRNNPPKDCYVDFFVINRQSYVTFYIID
jgi:hypothetical protein